jgi:hypothetical protein
MNCIETFKMKKYKWAINSQRTVQHGYSKGNANLKHIVIPPHPDQETKRGRVLGRERLYPTLCNNKGAWTSWRQLGAAREGPGLPSA